MDFANGGDADAQHELAIRYYYGTKDVAKDIKEAEYWWLKAAEQDHEYAVYSLAEKYLYHHRPEEAVKWYRKHAELRIAWREQYKSEFSCRSVKKTVLHILRSVSYAFCFFWEHYPP